MTLIKKDSFSKFASSILANQSKIKLSFTFDQGGNSGQPPGHAVNQ